MILIQVIPNGDNDAYRLLRDRVSRQAATWSWANKARTKLKHVQSSGHIEIGNLNGVLAARIYPETKADLFYLSEKFMGRLVAWFQPQLAAINVQFVADPKPKANKRRVKRRAG